MNVQMKMSKNGYRMWVMKNAKPKFGIVYHERGGMLLISYTSKAGNKYVYEFAEKTEKIDGEIFPQWFFNVMKNGKAIVPKHKELKSIPEPTCMIEMLLKIVTKETLTNFGSPKWTAEEI